MFFKSWPRRKVFKPKSIESRQETVDGKNVTVKVYAAKIPAGSKAISRKFRARPFWSKQPG